jgi:D-alanyl-lipoteichoic acid acyltransferase DltB (MBOAT superfamily)
MRSYSDEDLALARGIVHGLGYSLIIWIIMAAIAFAAYRW